MDAYEALVVYPWCVVVARDWPRLVFIAGKNTLLHWGYMGQLEVVQGRLGEGEGVA